MTEVSQLMKVKEWNDAVSYRIGCDCLSDDHDLHLWAESDEYGGHEIRMSCDLIAHGYRSRFRSPWLRWLDGPINRVAIAARILFAGRIEFNQEFILGKENVVALRTALDEIEEKFK